MKLRNLLGPAVLVAVVATFFLASTAFAGGWHKLGPTEGNAANTWAPDEGLWSDNSGDPKDNNKVPHYNLPSSSNNCRTCHAVHNANNVGKSMGNGLDLNQDGDYVDPGETAPSTGTGQAFKMLRNESRTTECYFCHGTSGALSNPIKKPYAPMFEDDDSNPLTPDVVVAAKGEHTLGATVIPDSTIGTVPGGSDGLVCGTCHSVHGGWTLNGLATAGTLNTRILRRDPAQNGNGSDGQGAGSGVKNVADVDANNKPIDPAAAATEPLSESNHLAGFCGDCHNKNVNWTTGGAGNEGDPVGGAVSEGTRPNKYGHPLGNIDGLIDIYGKLGRVESTTDVTDIRTGPLSTENDNRMSCDDCHKSRQVGANKFPHQSMSHKLLFNDYRDTSAYLDGGGDGGYTGSPDRPLPNLDAKVCRVCHGTDAGTSYPGIGNPSDSGSF